MPLDFTWQPEVQPSLKEAAEWCYCGGPMLALLMHRRDISSAAGRHSQHLAMPLGYGL